jgi:hypothetical protein
LLQNTHFFAAAFMLFLATVFACLAMTQDDFLKDFGLGGDLCQSFTFHTLVVDLLPKLFCFRFEVQNKCIHLQFWQVMWSLEATVLKIAIILNAELCLKVIT